MTEIHKIIGDNLKKLDLEKDENWQIQMSGAINVVVSTCEQQNALPFFSLVGCNCGCGKIYHIANMDIVSARKLPILLEEIAKQIRDKQKNLN